MPKPSAIGSGVTARIRRTIASAPAATWSRAPVTPSREMPYRNPLPSSAAFLIRASVVVGLSRKIVSMPADASVSRKLACLFDRQIERQHAVDAGLGGLPGERVEPQAQHRVRVAEDHDRRRDAAAAPSRSSPATRAGCRRRRAPARWRAGSPGRRPADRRTARRPRARRRRRDRAPSGSPPSAADRDRRPSCR